MACASVHMHLKPRLSVPSAPVVKLLYVSRSTLSKSGRAWESRLAMLVPLGCQYLALYTSWSSLRIKPLSPIRRQLNQRFGKAHD